MESPGRGDMLCVMLIGVVLLQVVQGVQAPRFPDFPKQDALSYALDLKVDFEAPRLSGTVAAR